MVAQSLIVILSAALSPYIDERVAAEKRLYQYAPWHLVELLQIIVDGSCDMAVRLLASIHFKNFIAKNWSPHEPGEHSKIMPGDKEMVRENIILFLAQVPALLREQLGECLKTIIDVDYPEHWQTLLHWVNHNLQDQQVYAALFVLRILARKYEFKLGEERRHIYHIIEETLPQLLNIFNRLVEIVNPSIEVADFVKLICKIFWSFINIEIPRQLFDLNVLNAWMTLFLIMLERPVPLEGQPADHEIRLWWKVKMWTVLILNHFYTRFRDLELQNPDIQAFAPMFLRNYARKILVCYLKLLNVIQVGGYLPDRVTTLVLEYLTSSISNSYMYELLKSQLDDVLFEIVFPLMCFNDSDQKLWDEDPHEFVRNCFDANTDLYSPRIAAIDFINKLMSKLGKENLQKFLFFIADIFKRYDEAGPEYKPYREKDGGLLAIGTLCCELKKTEPYKSELEHMLVQHVFPEFSSPVGHLRAKVAWVAGKYACINFSDSNNFRKALHSVIAGMRDPELPIRVNSVFALREFLEACKDFNEIRPILPQLLDELFKLTNEVESEEVVLTLKKIVDKFGEEMDPYALGLCQNLAAVFWKCINTAESDEGDCSGALAAVDYMCAIGTILESVNQFPYLVAQIEPILLPIVRRMLTTDGEDFEEALKILCYMTLFAPTISLDLWSLWPLLMEALADWAIGFFPSMLAPLENYISRGTSHFLTCKEPDYQQSLWNMISSIMADKNLVDDDIEPAPKLIEAVFHNCRGQVDHWVESYIRVSIKSLHRAKKPDLKCLLVQVIADALFYNPSLTLSILQKLGVAGQIFNLWFQMLRQTEKSGLRANFTRKHEKKVCCLGLTSLLTLPADQMSGQALESIFKAILDLLVDYKDQVEEATEEVEAGDEDDAKLDREMGGGDNGDEVDSLKLQNMAAQAKAFQSNDEELKSPFDEVDPFVFFVDTVKVLQASDSLRFQNLAQNLDLHYQALANDLAQHAEQSYIIFQ